MAQAVERNAHRQSQSSAKALDLQRQPSAAKGVGPTVREDMALFTSIGRVLSMRTHPEQELDHRRHQRDYPRPSGLPGCLMFLEPHGPLLKMHVRPAHASGLTRPTAREFQEDQESAKCRIGTAQ